MNPQDIARNLNGLRRERIKHGWSINDVATFVEVSERAIKKFEDCVQYPRRHTYNKLAAMFGWEVWE